MENCKRNFGQLFFAMKLPEFVASFFSSLLRIILVLAFCLAVTFVVVFPLWKFAVTLPRPYTIFALVLLFCAFVVFVFSRLKSRHKKHKD